MKPNLFPHSLLISVLFLSISTSPAFPDLSEVRTFTDNKGRKIEASVKSVTGNEVSIVLKDGKEFTITWSSLSALDQQFLKDLHEKQQATQPDWQEMNQAFGQSIFSEKSIWDSAPAAVSKSLKWFKQSSDAQPESFGIYLSENYRILGVNTTSARLLGRDGKIDELMFVFGSRFQGFRSTVKSERELLEKAAVSQIDSDLLTRLPKEAIIIGRTLDKLLGEGRSMTLPESEAKQWRSGDSVYSLTLIPGRSLELKITPAVPRDRSVDPQSFLKNIQKRINGDVLVLNIPYIAGNAVPAPFEAAGRYVNKSWNHMTHASIPPCWGEDKDYQNKQSKEVAKSLRSQNVNIEEIKGAFTLAKIKQQINQGFPIVWIHRSDSLFRGNFLSRYEERLKLPWEEYKKYLVENMDLQQLTTTDFELPDPELIAVTELILGYNPDNDEVAIDYRWDGDEWYCGWMHIDEVAHYHLSAWVIKP